jgi:hypothetical protein
VRVGPDIIQGDCLQSLLHGVSPFVKFLSMISIT